VYDTFIAWNVDGYNDEIHQWITNLIDSHHPTVLFLSETKKKKDDSLAYLNQFVDYNVIVNAHNPSKWHGVAMLIHKKYTYQQVAINMGIDKRCDSNDADPTTGRVIAIKINPSADANASLCNINIIGS